jgi:molybdate transport system substrate-binding protein
MRFTPPGPGLAGGACLVALSSMAGCEPVAPSEGVVRVAVAANFQDVHEELARALAASAGLRVVASVGSSGQLYAQIRNGAPFDVFLAADDERTRLLEASGLAIAGTRFTYATGRLALYGPTLDSVRDGAADLRDGSFRHLAIANPKLAPYGVAAEEVLSRLGVLQALAPRLVRGKSISQTFQFVGTGAAEMGLVALSQVLGEPEHTYWIVPAELHSPIVQEAVLLTDSPAAREYLEFLRSDGAGRIIEARGYEVPRETAR